VWWGTTKRILIGAIAVCVVPAAAARAEPPPARAWELVSPSEKGGNDVIAETSRTHAAASAAPGLPTAVAFASLGGFADAIGGGIATEYLAQRTAQPGTSGWSTHAITPPQEPLSVSAAAGQLDPVYEAFAPDLTRAVFRAWSPVTDAPDVTEVENLYAREDLRTPGAGAYRLLTDAPAPLAPIIEGRQRPFLAAATDDLAHVLLESRLPLTADTAGGNPALFKADGGSLRLLAPAGDCPGARIPDQPCSAAGLGATGLHLTGDTLSADGSRVVLTSPVSSSGNVVGGASPSRLYQLDDHGTTTTADDALTQLNASELTVPESPQPASFQAASADGARVWFTSAERLTDDAAPGGGLYLWEREAGGPRPHRRGARRRRRARARRLARRAPRLLRRARPTRPGRPAGRRGGRVPVGAGSGRGRGHDLVRRRDQLRRRAPEQQHGGSELGGAHLARDAGRGHAAARGLRG
jgi:hypothetical protein